MVTLGNNIDAAITKVNDEIASIKAKTEADLKVVLDSKDKELAQLKSQKETFVQFLEHDLEKVKDFFSEILTHFQHTVVVTPVVPVATSVETPVVPVAPTA